MKFSAKQINKFSDPKMPIIERRKIWSKEAKRLHQKLNWFAILLTVILIGLAFVIIRKAAISAFEASGVVSGASLYEYLIQIAAQASVALFAYLVIVALAVTLISKLRKYLRRNILDNEPNSNISSSSTNGSSSSDR